MNGGHIVIKNAFGLLRVDDKILNWLDIHWKSC